MLGVLDATRVFVFFVLFIDPKKIGQRGGGIACVQAHLSKFRERGGLNRSHRDRDYYFSTHAFCVSVQKHRSTTTLFTCRHTTPRGLRA